MHVLQLHSAKHRIQSATALPGMHSTREPTMYRLQSSDLSANGVHWRSEAISSVYRPIEVSLGMKSVATFA